MDSFALVLALLLVAPPSPSPAETPGGVVLVGHHGELEESAGTRTLHFSVQARSNLQVPVDSVYIGVLFAESPSVIEAANPSKLYVRGAQRGERIGVVKHLAKVNLTPKGEAVIEMALPLTADQPDARAFFSHVLGYGLVDASGELLLSLLGTDAPADEAAAVDALSLKGGVDSRRAVRALWGERSAVVRELAVEVNKPIPERPDESMTFRRVYAVRALGVLGGSVAEKALQRLAQDSNLSRFDEPFQILRIARLVGSEIETPLAFVVPQGAQRMSDLVQAAVADLTDLAKPAATPTPSPSPSEGAPKPAEDSPRPVLPKGGQMVELPDAGASSSLAMAAESSAAMSVSASEAQTASKEGSSPSRKTVVVLLFGIGAALVGALVARPLCRRLPRKKS